MEGGVTRTARVDREDAIGAKETRQTSLMTCWCARFSILWPGSPRWAPPCPSCPWAPVFAAAAGAPEILPFSTGQVHSVARYFVLVSPLLPFCVPECLMALVYAARACRGSILPTGAVMSRGASMEPKVVITLPPSALQTSTVLSNRSTTCPTVILVRDLHVLVMGVRGVEPDIT